MLQVHRIAPDRLEVVGAVDLLSVGRLRDALFPEVDRAVSERRAQLVVDLAGVDLVDATGLGVLLAAHRRARRGSCTLRLIRPSAQVAEMLLVSRLYRVLSVQWPGGATGAEEPRVLDLDRPAEVGDRVIDLDAPVPTPRGASAGTAETV